MSTAIFAPRMNRVLMNTFALLALSLVPTVFGVHMGIEWGFPAYMTAHPVISLLGFLAAAFALLIGIHATAQSAAALVPLTAFTFLMGGCLSGLINAVLKTANGYQYVALAFLGTIAALVSCTFYVLTTNRDFSAFGPRLMTALIGLIVVGVLNMIFQLSWLGTLLAAISLVVFTLFLIYDVQQIVNGGETNYILATVQVYLDLVNIFSDLLQLIFSFADGDD